MTASTTPCPAPLTTQPCPSYRQRGSAAAARAHALGLLASGVTPPDICQKGEPVPTVRQRAVRAAAHTRPSRQADPAGAAARIGAFLPSDPLALPHLPLLQDLTRQTRPVDAADAGELLSALASHAAWLTATGADVTADTLLDPSLVQRWALHALAHLSAGTAANYRSRLARVAAATGMADPKPAQLYASDPAEPYTLKQERALVWWAARLPSERRRADLSAVALLGFGAGLTSAEIVETTGDDLTVRADGTLTVTVHEPRARIVPVRDAYGPGLAELAAAAGPAPLFRPGVGTRVGKNAVSNLVTKALADADPAMPRLTPQRTRATWLVRHLDAGVRVDALAAAAGLDDLGSLDRYRRWLRPLTSDDTISALTRGKA